MPNASGPLQEENAVSRRRVTIWRSYDGHYPSVGLGGPEVVSRKRYLRFCKYPLTPTGVAAGFGDGDGLAQGVNALWQTSAWLSGWEFHFEEHPFDFFVSCSYQRT